MQNRRKANSKSNPLFRPQKKILRKVDKHKVFAEKRDSSKTNRIY